VKKKLLVIGIVLAGAIAFGAYQVFWMDYPMAKYRDGYPTH
jgi:hypothetical protein